MTTNRRKSLRLLRQVDLSRLWGKSRSTICALCAGRLAPAVANGRVNYDHPVIRQYEEERGLGGDNLLIGRRRPEEPSERRPLVVHDDAVSPAELAAMAGVTEEEVVEAMKNELADAVVPCHHVDVEQFAFIAGVETAEVIEAATSGKLAPAITRSGRLDLGHRASLRYLKAHPFKRDAAGAIVESSIPQGMLEPAIVDDESFDADSPFFKAFEARCGEAASG